MNKLKPSRQLEAIHHSTVKPFPPTSDCNEGVNEPPPGEHRFALQEIIAQAIKTLPTSETALTSCATRLADLKKRLEEERFHLAVLGQFKRGKSTLLNAILGESILPSAVIPLTSIPVFVHPAKSLHIQVNFTEGHARSISPSEIAEFVTEEKNPQNRKHVRSLEIGHCAPLLSHGIVLIDTPGIGSTFTHNTLTTLGFLPQCDAALFLVSVDPPITEVEVEFLRAVRKQIDRIFFVLNKVDYLDAVELQQAETFLLRVLREQVGVQEGIELFSISARQGLEAKTKADTSLWESSGMMTLESRIVGFAAREKTATLQRIITRRALDIGSEVTLHIDLEKRSLEIPLEDLNQRIDIFNVKLHEIFAKRQAVSDILAGEQRRAAQFIEDRSDEVREKVFSQLKPWMKKFFSEVSRSMRPKDLEEQFRERIEEVLPELFEEQGQFFFAELRARVRRAMDDQLLRVKTLFEAVGKTAAEIFEVRYVPVEMGAALPKLKDAYWETAAWSGTLGALSPQTLEKLLPSKMRRRKLEARLRDEVDRLVGQNVESLRWNAVQQTDEAFRRFTRDVDTRFRELVESTQGAMEAARKRRTENAGSVAASVENLLRFRESVEHWSSQLQSILV